MTEQCRAVKRNGQRCKNKAKAKCVGFCGVHFPQKKATEIKDKLWWIGTASGIATILRFAGDAIVNVMQTWPPGLFPPGLTHEETLPEVFPEHSRKPRDRLRNDQRRVARYILAQNAQRQTLLKMCENVLESAHDVKDGEQLVCNLENAFREWFSNLDVAIQQAVCEAIEVENKCDSVLQSKY